MPALHTSAAAGDDDLGVFQVDRFACFCEHFHDTGAELCVRRDGCDLRNSFRSSVASAADTDHCDRCFDLQGLLDGSAVDRTGDLQLAALFLQGDGIIDGRSAESRGNACSDQFSDRRSSQQHQSVSALSSFLCHGIRNSIFQKAAFFCFNTDSIGFRADRCSCREELQTCADRRAFLHFNEN